MRVEGPISALIVHADNFPGPARGFSSTSSRCCSRYSAHAFRARGFGPSKRFRIGPSPESRPAHSREVLLPVPFRHRHSQPANPTATARPFQETRFRVRRPRAFPELSSPAARVRLSAFVIVVAPRAPGTTIGFESKPCVTRAISPVEVFRQARIGQVSSDVRRGATRC